MDIGVRWKSASVTVEHASVEGASRFKAPYSLGGSSANIPPTLGKTTRSPCHFPYLSVDLNRTAGTEALADATNWPWSEIVHRVMPGPIEIAGIVNVLSVATADLVSAIVSPAMRTVMRERLMARPACVPASRHDRLRLPPRDYGAIVPSTVRRS